MLAYIKHGHLVYARGQTSTGSFVHETAATTGAGASSEPSVAINPDNDWPMIVWAQADGTYYSYRNVHGWYSCRVMHGSVRAMLTFDAGGSGNILAADGAGGLWYAYRSGNSWSVEQMDVHEITDLGGMGFTNMTAGFSYIRAGTHLYSVSVYYGC